MEHHTIVLMQPQPNKASRTFSDYDSVERAIDGICAEFERRLRELNPQLRSITYDIGDLYSWVDNMPDLSALVFEPKVQAYVPCGKEWIKKKAFTHLRRLADQAGRLH
ncbi:enhancer of rudimentary-like protein [Chlorella sorokiniana]|uniref:Enhancer of rudimentary homolog n=1 Tax=Chlorella sorokiniana TaxID=3076 RepID=A0A2P6TZQ6_CHLSO|nr:enhancer of rudimentary-like protein [Chlorella sorokiniana]|eukprot:PRW59552.1 enhancer of rudimentary-like protein [Chlorella sorokiniana]